MGEERERERDITAREEEVRDGPSLFGKRTTKDIEKGEGDSGRNL